MESPTVARNRSSSRSVTARFCGTCINGHHDTVHEVVGVRVPRCRDLYRRHTDELRDIWTDCATYQCRIDSFPVDDCRKHRASEDVGTVLSIARNVLTGSECRGWIQSIVIHEWIHRYPSVALIPALFR